MFKLYELSIKWLSFQASYRLSTFHFTYSDLKIYWYNSVETLLPLSLSSFGVNPKCIMYPCSPHLSSYLVYLRRHLGCVSTRLPLLTALTDSPTTSTITFTYELYELGLYTNGRVHWIYELYNIYSNTDGRIHNCVCVLNRVQQIIKERCTQ